MSDDLPAALERCVNHRPSLQADLGVHRAGRWHAELVEDVEHAPDADPLAVFAPRPVRVVIDISRQIAADDTGTPGIERLRRILSHVPVFEIGRDHDSESLPVRPPKRLPRGNRHKFVFHGLRSRRVEHLMKQRLFSCSPHICTARGVYQAPFGSISQTFGKRAPGVRFTPESGHRRTRRAR